MLNRVDLVDSKKGEYLSFVEDDFYIMTKDSTFVATNSFYENEINLLSKSRKDQQKVKYFIRLNNRLEVVKIRSLDNYWKYLASYNSLEIISNEDEIVVLNKKGKKVAGFKAGNDSKVIGNTLYIVREKMLLKIDLSQF